MLKRNFNYNVGNIDYNLDGTRLVCKVAGTTGIDPLIIPSGATEVVDGTVTWSLVDYAGVDYSLDEKKIGTWIGGKPLYQKTYSLISPYVSDNKVELAELPIGVNVENVVAIEAIIVSIDGAFIPHFVDIPANDYCAVFIRPNRKIVCRVGLANKEHKPLFITIQYTKTTD